MGKRSETKTYPCGRCAGEGTIRAFGHVLAGVCFKCAGSGKQKSKPVTSQLWAVYGTRRINGARVRLYNVRARTADLAVKRAFVTMQGANDAFKAEFDLATAPSAVLASEVVEEEQK